MVDALLRIAPSHDTRAFWKLHASCIGFERLWKDYRKLLVEQTPGAEEDRRYTTADLAALVSKYQRMPNLSMNDFNRLWTKFYAISDYLKSRDRLSAEESPLRLLECLPYLLRRDVKAQLRRQYPRHHPEDPYQLQEIYDAVLFVLSTAQEYPDSKPIPLVQETSQIASVPCRLQLRPQKFETSTHHHSDLGVYANPVPQSKSEQRHITETSTAKTGDAACNASPEALQAYREDYDEDDVSFAEAVQLQLVRCVQDTRRRPRSTRACSANDAESIPKRNSEENQSAKSYASPNLVANYGGVSHSTLESQQGNATLASTSSFLTLASVTPRTSHNDPTVIHTNQSITEPSALEKHTTPTENEGAVAAKAPNSLHPVDSRTIQIVHVVSEKFQNNLVAPFIVSRGIGRPSLSSIEPQLPFKTIHRCAFTPSPTTFTYRWPANRVWSPGTDPPACNEISLYNSTVFACLMFTIFPLILALHAFRSKLCLLVF